MKLKIPNKGTLKILQNKSFENPIKVWYYIEDPTEQIKIVKEECEAYGIHLKTAYKIRPGVDAVEVSFYVVNPKVSLEKAEIIKEGIKL